jgi:putative CocE/NonD family hydrolase
MELRLHPRRFERQERVLKAGELFGVRVLRNVLIPLSDGVSLAGDLFLPEAPGPFPALVSYYPYHKDDLIGALFDHPNRYFAARGYASVLVDLRGLGNSEGLAWDVGDPREGTDGAEIVEWAAGQSWCDGNVGMWGMSYGGITSFKTAAVSPPHLKAIVPMNGGLDHYHDIVYPGGCFNCLGILGGWGPFMTAMNLMPPMHQDADGRWYRLWRERLDAGRAPYIMPYQQHPDFDKYWESKTVAGERITVPAFLIGAWRDIFPEAMVRAYERARGPRRLLMGPWMHEMPDLAGFAQVDYLAEMLRWWDCWLKGVDNGVRDEPPVVIYVQGQGWRYESEWPIARTSDSVLYLNLDSGIGTLATEPPPHPNEVSYVGDPTVGVMAGLWDPTGTGLGAPLDQGPDDLRSITFTGDPLPDALEITGSPEATVNVALDEGADSNLVVKICDVGPDGHSALITTGWAKASRRLGHDETPSSAKEALEFRVPLWATSYVIQAGHRLRMSLSCSDFPRIWPTRSNPRIRLATGGRTPSLVRLPVVPASQMPVPDLPVPDPSVKRTPLDIEATPRWEIVRDMAAGTVLVSTGIRSAIQTTGRDGRFEIDRVGRASVSAARPDGATVEGEATIKLLTPQGSNVTVRSRLRVTQNGQDFRASVTMDGQLIFDRQWASERSSTKGV